MTNRRFTSAAIAAVASLALLAGTGSAVATEGNANAHVTVNGSSVKVGGNAEGENSGSSVDDITAKIKNAFGSSTNTDEKNDDTDNGDKKEDANGSSIDDITAKIKNAFGSSTNTDEKNDGTDNGDKKEETGSNAKAEGGFKLALGLGALALVFSFAYNWAVQHHLIAPFFH
ncbi:hypothetical protein [Corynebacterium sp. CCM 9204]|uniref:hypothetical protein n=1 Tax=Corynebacterium sp. CCM 9204 TaxID=3057616 RepID=UPI003523A098